MSGATIAALAAAFSTAYAGWVVLSLAMDRHHDQILGRRSIPGQRNGLRGAGAALLILSAAISIAGWGSSIGLLGIWGGTLSAAACLYAFLLPYAPRTAAAMATLALPGVGAWLAMH